jgi:hypothetical protein
MPNNKKIIACLIILLIIITTFVLKSIMGFIPLPIWVRHLVHLYIEPKNLYQPIVLDKFMFHEYGYTKSYYLFPKYYDLYEIGFLINGTGIETTYKFKGRIKAEFFCKDRFLFDKIITSMDQAWFNEKDMHYYKRISLLKFEIPIQNKYVNDLSIRLTVTEPDFYLKSRSDFISLYISVSPSP